MNHFRLNGDASAIPEKNLHKISFLDLHPQNELRNLYFLLTHLLNVPVAERNQLRFRDFPIWTGAR